MNISLVIVQPFNVAPCREAIYFLLFPNSTKITNIWHYGLSIVIQISQMSIACFFVIYNLGMDEVVGYVSGATSTTVSPFIYAS